MNSLVATVKRVLVAFARWYRSPTGLLSGVALVAAAVAVLASSHGIAIAIIILWLAVVIPYKFIRDREELVARLEAVEFDHVTRIAKLDAQAARLASEVAMSPTLAETDAWLESMSQDLPRVEPETD